MSRPLPEFRIPTPISIAIATISGGAGFWLWRSAVQTAATSSGGHAGNSWLILLLIAGAAFAVAAFAVAAFALHFARSRLVFWIGVAGIVAVFSL